MNSDLGSRSDIRSLRKLTKIDYKKMSDGEGQKKQETEHKTGDQVETDLRESPHETLLGASGTSATSRSDEPAFGQFEPSEPLFDDFDREQDEAEIVAMQLQMKRLNAEEARLERKRRLDQMKKELYEQKQRVRDMKGKDISQATKTSDSVVKPKIFSAAQTKISEKVAKVKTTDSKSKIPISSIELDSSETDTEQVTIDDLRKNPKLQKKVQKELNKLGLKCLSIESSSESESSDSSTSSSSDSDSLKKKKKKHKKHKKSGINAKSSDKVKDPQRWPHAYLQYEFVNKQVKFDELDFKLFLAGEISIIAADDLSESERKGRLDLLKKIIYYSNTYEFKGLKAFYAAWLREIELGKKKWSDDPSQIETAVLSKFLLKNKGSSSFSKKDSSNKPDVNEEKTWFCSEFQRNKCKHKSSHLRVHNGKQRLASHICASCWLKDKKKLEHPECSSSCPHLAD